jgi:hypothetical protein
MDCADLMQRRAVVALPINACDFTTRMDIQEDLRLIKFAGVVVELIDNVSLIWVVIAANKNVDMIAVSRLGGFEIPVIAH